MPFIQRNFYFLLKFCLTSVKYSIINQPFKYFFNAILGEFLFSNTPRCIALLPLDNSLLKHVFPANYDYIILKNKIKCVPKVSKLSKV